MKPRIQLLTLLLLSCLLTHGSTFVNTDTIPMPSKMMELPSVVKNYGDRAGTWGLPTLIALRYGLTVNDTLDERLDDDAAAKAATRYLYDLYAEFGDWDQCYFAYLYSPAYVRNLQARHLDTIISNFDIQRYRDSFKGKPYIPSTVKKTVIAKPKPPKAKEKAKEPKYITYVVQKGDTLSKIAKKYRVTVKDIMKWNNLKNDRIRDKQKLKIRQ